MSCFEARAAIPREVAWPRVGAVLRQAGCLAPAPVINGYCPFTGYDETDFPVAARTPVLPLDVLRLACFLE